LEVVWELGVASSASSEVEVEGWAMEVAAEVWEMAMAWGVGLEWWAQSLPKVGVS